MCCLLFKSILTYIDHDSPHIVLNELLSSLIGNIVRNLGANGKHKHTRTHRENISVRSQCTAKSINLSTLKPQHITAKLDRLSVNQSAQSQHNTCNHFRMFLTCVLINSLHWCLNGHLVPLKTAEVLKPAGVGFGKFIEK